MTAVKRESGCHGSPSFRWWGRTSSLFDHNKQRTTERACLEWLLWAQEFALILSASHVGLGRPVQQRTITLVKWYHDAQCGYFSSRCIQIENYLFILSRNRYHFSLQIDFPNFCLFWMEVVRRCYLDYGWRCDLWLYMGNKYKLVMDMSLLQKLFKCNFRQEKTKVNSELIEKKIGNRFFFPEQPELRHTYIHSVF